MKNAASGRITSITARIRIENRAKKYMIFWGALTFLGDHRVLDYNILGQLLFDIEDILKHGFTLIPKSVAFPFR